MPDLKSRPGRARVARIPMLAASTTVLAAGLLAFGCSSADIVAPPGGPAAIVPPTMPPSGRAGDSLPTISVTVETRSGAPSVGVAVRWSVVGTIGSVAPAVSTTDAQGHATATWTLGPSVGAQRLTASVDGAPPLDIVAAVTAAAPASLALPADTMTLTALADSVAIGATVVDRFGNPSAVSPTFALVAPGDSSQAPVALRGAWMVATRGGTASLIAHAGAAADTMVVRVAQRPTSLRLTSDADTLRAIGDTLRLGATVADANGFVVPGQPVAWHALDPAVVTVDSAGHVAAVARGATRVVAALGQAADSATIVVSQQVATVAVDRDSIVMHALGDTARLGAVALDGRGIRTGDAVTWRVDAPAVATVSTDGLVTAVADGEAVVTAFAGGDSARVPIRVAQLAARLRLDVPSSLFVGDSASASMVALDSLGSALAASVAMASSDSQVVALRGRTLMAESAGTAWVVGTLAPVRDSALVTVSLVPVASVQVTPDSAALSVGDTVAAAFRVFDARGRLLDGRTASWSSDAPAVARVDASGRVFAVAGPGRATITATVDGVSASLRVTVREPVAAVVPRDSVLWLARGDAHALAATVIGTAGDTLRDRAIAWSSSDPTVAGVASDGTVSARSAGSAAITATVEGHSATVPVNVEVPAQLAVTPDTIRLTLGESALATAIVRDGAGHVLSGDGALTWSSTLDAVATVDTAGAVRGVAPGLSHVIARIDALADSIPVLVQASPAFTLAPRYRLAAIDGAPVPAIYATDSLRSYEYVSGSFEFSSDTAVQLLTRTDSTFSTHQAVTSSVGQHGLYLVSGRTVLLLSRVADGVSDSLYAVGDTLVREVLAGYGDTWYLGPRTVLRFQFLPDTGVAPAAPTALLAPSAARDGGAGDWSLPRRRTAPGVPSRVRATGPPHD